MTPDEPNVTEHDLAREHMGREGEKQEDPRKSRPQWNTHREFARPKPESDRSETPAHTARMQSSNK
jgi:hypothetical protein